MRVLLWITSLFIISFSGHSQNHAAQGTGDSLSAVKVNGRVEIANVGFAPVSAFSFDSPIAIAFLTLKKKRFRYEPDFAFGLNGKPWMNSNWFRFDFFARKELTLNAGINPFLFFKNERMLSGEKLIQVQRSLTFELGADHRLSKRWSFNLTYQYNKGCDTGTLTGHFFAVSSSLADIGISKSIRMTFKSKLFCFDFTGDIEGLFTSEIVRIEHRQTSFSINFQGVLPLWVNFPGNHFNWNTGVAYTF